jgi:thymidylate kinase
MTASKDMFLAFIEVLEDAAVPYCILAGYDDYPEHIGSDVDFMVPVKWVDRLPALVAAAAARCGAHVIQQLKHETTATYFVIARLDGSSVSYLHPDSSSDYRRGWRRWLDADEVLGRRRRHLRGFWIPSAADAFAYYLIKKIDKAQPLLGEQAEQLERRFSEDPEGGARVLRALLPGPLADQVENAARGGNWSELPPLERLRGALHRRAPADPVSVRLRQAISDLRRVTKRVAAPTGLHVAFLGPDGSGKSSIISRVCEEMSRAFRRVHYQHLRPGLLSRAKDSGPVTDPHARPVRGRIGSTLKLLHFWLDFVLASFLWIKPRKVRSTFLVFDRYYHDILADPRRYRYGGSIRLARWLGRTLVPHPDLVFILDAPAQVLQERKKEIPLKEGERQRAAYLALKSEFDSVRVIDVAQPLDKVVADVLGHIIAFQKARTATRLGIDQRTDSSALADPAL